MGDLNVIVERNLSLYHQAHLELHSYLQQDRQEDCQLLASAVSH